MEVQEVAAGLAIAAVQLMQVPVTTYEEIAAGPLRAELAARGIRLTVRQISTAPMASARAWTRHCCRCSMIRWSKV
jgi:hypothetical protein